MVPKNKAACSNAITDNRRQCPRLLTAIIIALCTLQPVAARQGSRLSINAGGGLSMLNYKPTEGSSKFGFGGTLGIDYSWFFHKYWGVSAGLDAVLFSGGTKLPDLAEVYQSYDGEENLEFNYTLKNYSERQSAILLTIPLMLRFEIGMFYAAVGGRMGIPLKTFYKNEASELQTSGYFPGEDLTLYDPAYLGFGKFNNISSNGKIELKPAFFASAEAGLKWSRLHVGIYVDYGVNNIKAAPAQSEPLIPYNLSDPSNYRPNSMLTASTGGKGLIDKVIPLAAGIKISVTIVRSRSNKMIKVHQNEPPLEKEHYIETTLPKTEEDTPSEVQIIEAETAKAETAKEETAKEEARKAEVRRKYEADIQTLLKPSAENYSLGSTAVSPSMKTELDSAAKILQRYPDLRITIEGHTCDIGTPAVNIKIGQQRADEAKACFVEKGIEASRITTVSKGSTEPSVPNTNEENRKKNRRIKIILN